MASFPTCRRTLLLLAALASLSVGLSVVADTTKVPLVIADTEIQRCAPVQQLSAIKREMEASQSLVMRQVFSWLFPFGPGWNSVLGTFYISSSVSSSEMLQRDVMSDVRITASQISSWRLFQRRLTQIH
ncbi:hypothetical protein AcV5_008610 [Taiwanofungus camphoratus]|nr:hypothetical protein AcV5_008610 [Antrodia cinnamomea]